MKKLFREPLVHFLVLGLALFALHSWRRAGRADAESTAAIEVTAAVIQRLQAGYERQFGRTPDEGELRGLVVAHIREEVLYREARALGLDRDDTIVRRRLAQKMEFLTEDLANGADPDQTALAKFFAENAIRYARPGRVSFRHVYFSKEKRGLAVWNEAREGLAKLDQGENDDTLGDAFLHGFEFIDRAPEDLAALFGPEFTTALFEGASSVEPHNSVVRPGRWHGPIASSYGVHLVQVESRTESQPVTLSEVRPTVERDFNEERRRLANREVFERLKQRYQIAVDESAIVKAAAQPVTTAQVTR